MRCDVHKGKLRGEEGYQIKSFLNLNVEEDGRRILEWVPTGLLSLKWGLWYMINVHAQFSNILYMFWAARGHRPAVAGIPKIMPAMAGILKAT